MIEFSNKKNMIKIHLLINHFYLKVLILKYLKKMKVIIYKLKIVNINKI